MSRNTDYDFIAAEIHSDSSPVGIDAKKTHILILQSLAEVLDKLDNLNERVATLENKIEA